MKYITFKYFMKAHLHLLVSLLLFSTVACKKFIKIDPPNTTLVTKTVFQNESSATASITAIYSQMVNDMTTYNLSYQPGLYADELVNFSLGGIDIAYYVNNLDPRTNSNFSLWSNPYKYIYQANAAWEGCNTSTSLDQTVKKQLMAEARFIRAFWYFYLINLYGDVPLITTTNYSTNAKTPRTSIDQVYKQIILDLQYAEDNLNSKYVDNTDTTSTNERVRPNKYVAAALLARTYLFTKDYKRAENEATKVIKNTLLYDTVSLDKVFLKNSRAAIWQIPPSSSTANYETWEGRNYILTAAPTSCIISPDLVNTFEMTDKRKSSWIGKYVDESSNPSKEYLFPFKYKVKNTDGIIKEYTMVLRLAEQYLIRAEARAQQDKIKEAQSDLNIIRHRSGLSNTEADTKESLLTAILHERQVELFTEWGHRWLDLKRTKNADRIMTQVAFQKGGTWAEYKKLWPIPYMDIEKNTDLKQNQGYK